MYRMTRQRYNRKQREYVREVYLMRGMENLEEKQEFLADTAELSNRDFIARALLQLNSENCGYLFPEGLGIVNEFYTRDPFEDLYDEAFDGVNVLIGGLN